MAASDLECAEQVLRDEQDERGADAVRKAREELVGLRGHRDGLYKVFHALAEDDRPKLAQVDEMIQMDVDAIVDLRIELASVRKALLAECEGCREGWPIVDAPDPQSRSVHEEPMNGKRHACSFSDSLRAVANATRISSKGLGPR